MSIENLTVTEKQLKHIESISMTLLTMVESYDLPEPVSLVIEDLNDKAESLRVGSIVNHSSNKNILDMKAS